MFDLLAVAEEDGEVVGLAELVDEQAASVVARTTPPMTMARRGLRRGDDKPSLVKRMMVSPPLVVRATGRLKACPPAALVAMTLENVDRLRSVGHVHPRWPAGRPSPAWRTGLAGASR
jgi:hypothetical protein